MLILGGVAFTLSLVTSIVGILVSSLGIYTKKSYYSHVASHIFHFHFYTLLVTVLSLVGLLIQPNLSVIYVIENVNIALPLFYKITSLWAGQAGSLLWWNFILVFLSLFAVRNIKKTAPELTPYVILIILATSLFFCLLGNFSLDSNPFLAIKNATGSIFQQDGRGLNPLLQHWAMVIHPPILYLGYISFAIPYAIAMATLWHGSLTIKWTKMIRRWTLFSWFFLGFGVLLGGKWAYEELGWGGYWAWDPVENASLMPWLTSTAFLHSIIVQEKRGMFKIWNMILVSLSYFMCIFGTFLTRSGVVNSVHAFASTDLGDYFVTFLIAIVLFSSILILLRLPLLKSEQPINSYLSKEAGFLLNNVFFLLALCTLIWGTLYPSISEFILNERISVSAPWFNQWMVPIGLIILFLTGVAPLLSWRTTKLKTLKRNFKWPTIMATTTIVITIISLYYLEYTIKQVNLTVIWAIITFMLAAFVITGVWQEVYTTTAVRQKSTDESFMIAFLKTIILNKRRYIGYLVHLSLAILFIGFAGKAFTKEKRVILAKGEYETLYGYTILLEDYKQTKYPEKGNFVLYWTEKVTIALYKDNKLIGRDTTEKRLYPMYNIQMANYSDQQVTSEPAIISHFLTDVYVQYAAEDTTDNQTRLILQVWINPLVFFVWFSFGFFVVLGFILLLPFGESGEIKLGKKIILLKPQINSKLK